MDPQKGEMTLIEIARDRGLSPCLQHRPMVAEYINKGIAEGLNIPSPDMKYSLN